MDIFYCIYRFPMMSTYGHFFSGLWARTAPDLAIPCAGLLWVLIGRLTTIADFFDVDNRNAELSAKGDNECIEAAFAGPMHVVSLEHQIRTGARLRPATKLSAPLSLRAATAR